MIRGLVALLVVFFSASALQGGTPFTPAEKTTIASLSLSALPPLPADPTNRYADGPGAAALGSTLFFDTSMSPGGTVSCATCHKLDRQFQDDLPQGFGVSRGNRRTLPLAGVAYNRWFFWDGRRDSLWAQALTPLEDAREQAGNRAFYAHYIERRFKARYERIFGPMPDLSNVPADASPLGTPAERAAWEAMTADERQRVNGVFANLGKAFEAFERSIMPPETRFDRFAKALAIGATPEGDAAFSDQEIQGLKLFIGKAGCVACHDGPRFTDGRFHNDGTPPAADLPPDRGRADVIAELEADPFNCRGAFSDGRADDCTALESLVRGGPQLVGAFKVPSLRGVGGRPPYMHAGQFKTLEDVVANYVEAPPAAIGTSEVRPLDLTADEKAALVAFLKTLGQ